jgi:hypothetical protein
MIEENHVRNMLLLVLACSYLRKLLAKRGGLTVPRAATSGHPCGV